MGRIVGVETGRAAVKTYAKDAAGVLEAELDLAERLTLAKGQALVNASNIIAAAGLPVPAQLLDVIAGQIDSVLAKNAADPGLLGQQLAAQNAYRGRAPLDNADNVWADLSPDAACDVKCLLVAAVATTLAKDFATQLTAKLDQRRGVK